MGQAIFHRSEALRPTTARAAPRRLPRGYGLLAGAVISLALWAGLFWLAAQLIG